MPRQGIVKKYLNRLVKIAFAGAVFLLPVENAYSDADLTTSTSSFVSADPANRPNYMDSGGVWNGVAVVTNTVGDTFRLTVINNAPGTTPTEIQDNTSYGIAISAAVATGFRLPTAPFGVTVTELSGGGNCLAIGPVNATQPGGIGTPINFNVPAADIPPGCEYQFDLGLTTSSAAPFVASGTYPVAFTVSYSNFDGTPVSPTELEIVNIEVRTSDVAILKTAQTTIAGDTDPVTFNVDVIATGPGGIFNVIISDTLSVDFAAASLNMTTVPAEGAEMGAFASPNYTIAYLHPNDGVITISTTADVQVDPNAVFCPILSNQVDVTEATGGSGSSTDTVAFDLQEPLLVFAAPNITVPLNGGASTTTIDVTNSGTGTAKNISLTVPGAGTDLDNFNITVTSPGWSFNSATDVFTYSGTITAGATQSLSFTLEATACPPPSGGALNWTLTYQNVCGNVFNPADQNSNLTVGNVPAATITKTSSVAVLNIGQSANYTLALGGTDLAALPATDAIDNNNDFTVTDTFPAGIQDIEIPVIPANTEVEVQGVGIFTGSVPPGQIPAGGTIIWRGDSVDLQSTPAMQANFVGTCIGTSAGGQTVTNTAALITTCGINNNDAAAFVLNETPANADIGIQLTAAGPFETGTADTNGISRDQVREGEAIPFRATYSFPTGFNGQWGGTRYDADLGSGLASPLVLTQDGSGNLLINVIVRDVTNAIVCNVNLPPAAFTIAGNGALTIGDIGTACSFVATRPVADESLQISYSATSPEGNVDGLNNPTNDLNIGTYTETATLTVASGTPGCTTSPSYTQSINVTLERADLDITGSINGGAPVDVCSIVPVTINLNQLNGDTSVDNLLFNLSLTNLRVVDGTDVDSVDIDTDISRANGFTPFTLTATTPITNNEGPIAYELLPISTNLSANGQLSFNARVLDVGAEFNATISFDSKHTSPDAAASENDRDYSFSLNNFAPASLREADLDLEFFPPQIILRDQASYSFRAHIVNTGDGDAVGGVFEITLPPEMNYVSSSSIPAGVAGVPAGQTVSWDLSQSALGVLGTGEAIDIDINVAITQQSCFQGGVPDEINSLTNWGCGSAHLESYPDTPPIVLPSAQVTLTHDLNNSFCELCNEGEIHLIVRNSGGLLTTDVDVTEDLLATGLEYVALSTTCIADDGPCNVIGEPTILGTQITWTKNDIQQLDNLYSAFSTAPNTPQQIEIIFRVRRPIGDEEALVGVLRNIEASGQYGLFCDQNAASPVRLNALSENIVLPIKQPVPQVVKQGRNVDAAQSSSQYTDTVYGGRGDRVLWRINVRNLGNADLEDLLLNDTIVSTLGGPANLNFLAVCPAELLDAAALSRPFAIPAGCVAPDAVQLTVEDVDGLFGAGGANGEDVLSNSNEYVYILGEILNQCTNMDNVADVSWGCHGEDTASPFDLAGGIILPASPIPAGFDLDDGDPENLSTAVNPAGVTVIAHTATGVDGGNELGYRGRISFTIRNGSGGTVKTLELRDTLPSGYAIDPTQFTLDAGSYYLPLSVTTNFGNNYIGMVERVLWSNRDASFENNIAPEFQLVSDPNVAPIEEAPDRINIIRHGDEITLTFDIVRITDFDFQGAPDLPTEASATCSDPRFPAGFTPIAIINPPADCPAPVAAGFPDQSNQLEIGFDNSCDVTLRDINPVTPTLANTTALNNISIDPEDLDIDIDPGTNRVYILSDPVAFLDLPVVVTNNGGHDADNHYILVSVGGGLSLVGGAPAGCSALPGAPVGRAPPTLGGREIWPPDLPATSIVYRCAAGNMIAAGATNTYNFRVQKQGAGTDLTFRADIIGDILLEDNATVLTFPAVPTPGFINYASNFYTLDSIRARIIGFNLVKTLPSNCSEDAAVVAPLENVEIGEDCRYHINASWFGFETPGFGNITVENVIVTDTLEPGLGFVGLTPAVGMGITSSTLPVQFADDTDVIFNLDPILDHLVDATTFDINLDGRIVNDPLNLFGATAPNYHGQARKNEANASFRVYFDRGGPTETFIDFNDLSAGYPPATQREVDVTVTEPNLVVTKTICNRTLTPACAPADFTNAATGGDADDVYIVRVRLFNDDSAGADTRATAYDVAVSSLMDADAVDDLLLVQAVNLDGLDNDGDAIADQAGEAGNITLTNNGVGDGQGQIDVIPTFDIASGATVDLFYRIDVDDSAIPGQSFDLSVSASFDSLDGPAGAQNPASASGTLSGARQYTVGDSATLTVSSIGIATPSKGFLNKSNLADVALPGPVGPAYTTADVTIGEEVRVQLSVEIPVSTLKNFRIADQLPPGMTCIEADALVFSTTPDANGLRFTTAGSYSATGCPGTGTVSWQATVPHILEDTTLPASNDIYTLSVSFIARIDNETGNLAGTNVINGDENGAAAGVGAGTNVTVSYDDEQLPANTISLDIPSAAATVREPNIQLTITTGTVNATPPPLVNAIANADAGDIYTVAVTLDNNSATPANLSPAYNLQVFADLTAISGASYVPASLAGPNAADFTVVTAGPTQLVLNYNNAKLDPSASLSFTFNVLLPDNVQPHDILQTGVTATYSSLASNTIALNGSGSIGVDGNTDGMRLYSAAETDTTASVPGLLISKVEAALSDPVATIGARKRFQLQIDFPEGVTRSDAANRLVVNDNLAAAGSTTSYILENNPGYPILYEFSGIQSINGITNSAQFANQITAPANGSANIVPWTFNGDVVTNTEEDLDAAADFIDPYIRITYYARINDNLATTNAGDLLVNSVLANYFDRASAPRVTAPQSVGPFTVVEPDLRMNKSASATINFGAAETYTLDIRNDGGSTAWNAIITDVLIEPTPGGMCDTSPLATLQAEIQDNLGATQHNLFAGTDYTATFSADPGCTLTLNMLSAAASIEPGWHLVVTYDASLDLDNINGSQLDNIAGATRYYSLEQVNADARTYNNTLSVDYATAVAAVAFEDYEDAHRISVGAPQLVITQSVVDAASPPGVLAASILSPLAQPGDTIRYQIHIVNQGPLAISGFSLTEDLDLLNPGAGYYLANTLNVVAVAGGNDFSNPLGGTKATGYIDIQNLNIAADNVGNTDELVIHYDVTLVPVITNGTQVKNQGQASIVGFSTILSDDPDPALLSDTDPTVLAIDSRPVFLVEKTAQDITGDANSLQAGDILRYTITVKNIGKENSVNVLLKDLIPANTAYVANSVSLNGSPVGVPDNGSSPLQNGVLINAPENTTPGFMRAVDISALTDIATVTFDVRLDIDLVNGAVVSNQAFVTGQGAGSGAFGTSPSDDPATPVVGDPTRSVVGNLPILEVQKTVDFTPGGDTNADGIIDPGETMRYTISVQNFGDSNATAVVLVDSVPVNTTYIADTVQLNGLSVAVPDGGTSPLDAGIDISSSDLTPPLPLANQGQITAGQTATITFDVTVTGVVGDLISNQASVSSVELPDELSDADGDPSNGNQPTVFVVGNVQQLLITKNAFVVDGGLAAPGKQLEYVIHVENIGSIPATDIVVTDIIPANLTYVANSAFMNGASSGTSFTSTPDTITANYEATYNDLDAGESFTVHFRALIDSAAVIGTTIINTATVSWNAGADSDNASVQIDVGGAPGVGTLTGQVWNDADHNDIFDLSQGDIQLPNWTVDVYFKNVLLDSAITDTQGNYRFLGLPVSGVTNDYDLVFIAEGGNTSSAKLGTADATKGINGLHRIDDFNVNVGEAVFEQNLPIEPNGVIYNSLLRSVIPGATVRLLNPAGNAVPAACFPVDANQQNQVTTSGGYYRFDLNFSDPINCPNNANYTVEVIPPVQGYTAGTSVLVPPANDVAVYDVPNCPGDVNGATAECEIQPQISAPDSGASPNSSATRYYLIMKLANAPPVDNQAYNNHIPVDPDEFPAGGISITKASALLNVNRGQLIPYVIRVTNNLDVNLFEMEVRDSIPAGFKYVQRSSLIEDPSSVPTVKKGDDIEPVINGLQLTWDNLDIASGETVILKMLLIVGSGVGEGEYVNRATAFNGLLQIQASETATATVRVVPDPTFDCSDVVGKVFDDKNLNGYQDDGEAGIASARVISAQGLQVTTDKHGRFHITCAAVPNRDRGSNFILKLDSRSLPTGYRVTTENPRVQRATRGKMLKYNFGAAIHRVVRLDMADAVFVPGTTEMRVQWKSRLDLLMTELVKDPSVLRLSYLAEVEETGLVDDRLNAVKDELSQRWQELNCCYTLMIETEIFWRTGAPPDRGELE